MTEIEILQQRLNYQRRILTVLIQRRANYSLFEVPPGLDDKITDKQNEILELEKRLITLKFKNRKAVEGSLGAEYSNLAELELLVAGYTSTTIPAELRVDLEDKRKRVEELEFELQTIKDGYNSYFPAENSNKRIEAELYNLQIEYHRELRPAFFAVSETLGSLEKSLQVKQAEKEPVSFASLILDLQDKQHEAEELEKRLAKLPPIPDIPEIKTIPTRTKVFISCSKPEQELLSKLRTQLGPMINQGIIDLWDHTSLKAGSVKKTKIKENLQLTKIAVLLISADYLYPDVDVKDELDYILANSSSDEDIRVIPIIAGSIMQQTLEVYGLDKFQSVNDIDKPLKLMEGNELERALVKIATEIISASTSFKKF